MIPRTFGLSTLTVGHGKKHLSVTRSSRPTPANEIHALQFPANIIYGERKRSGI
jgi:hypothetical protein